MQMMKSCTMHTKCKSAGSTIDVLDDVTGSAKHL